MKSLSPIRSTRRDLSSSFPNVVSLSRANRRLAFARLSLLSRRAIISVGGSGESTVMCWDVNAIVFVDMGARWFIVLNEEDGKLEVSF